MGFTKLDEGILQSSIMAEDPATFKVWIALLASCKQNGMAKVSPTFLSAVCRLPLDVVVKSMEKLCSPDPHSRSQDEEGRRIKRVEHGWKLINFAYYRRYTYSDSPDSIRQRRYREKKRDKRDVSQMSQSGRDISASASASASNIKFSFEEGEWGNIKDDDIASWKEAFPACDIALELRQMIEWIKANPAKGKKKNYRRFIVNWLARKQERGGTIGKAESREDYIARQNRALGRKQ